MNRTSRLLFFAAAIGTCTPGFARQTVTADPTQLNVDGGLNGADITGSHTLLIGVLGGPTLDIYTNNPSPYIGTTAVGSPTGNDQGMAQFNVNSSVFGDMGAATTHVLHSITVSDNVTANFMGSVYSTLMSVGTGTANFNGGANATNTVAPNFTGDGFINVARNTTVTGALTTNTDNTGTLTLGAGSQWTGAIGGPGASAGLKSVGVSGGSNSAGVVAGITGAVYTHAISLLTNTLNIGGALTIANNGVINATLASSALYGHIVPSGGPVTIGTGVEVKVDVPTTAYFPVGTKFTIVQPQNGGTTGAGLTASDPSNPLYKFVVVDGTPGQVEINTTAIPLQTADSPVVPVLLGGPLTADLGVVLAAINALSDPAAVANAVAQLGPSSPSLAAPRTTFQGARQFQNLSLSRLNVCSETSQPNQEMATCQEKKSQGGLWMNGFGYFGEQDGRDKLEGYDETIAGTMIAYEMPLGLNTRAGVGLGFAQSLIDGHTSGRDTDTDIKTYQTMAYIGHDEGPWYVQGTASFGWNNYSENRPIEFPGISRTATADYSGQDYTSMVKSGYHVALSQKVTLTPLVSLQYTRVSINHYTEGGAGDLDLRVDSQGYNFLQTGLGTKVERDFSYRRRAIVPEVHVEWLHDVFNPTTEQTTAFTAAGFPSFRTSGFVMDPDTFHVGTSVSVLACACAKAKMSADAGYDYYWKNHGYSANQVTLRLSVRF